VGSVEFEIETSLNAPPTLAPPEEISYEKYRSLKGVLDGETYGDAIAQLQNGNLCLENFNPSTVRKVSEFEESLKTTFSPQQIFLYCYLHDQLPPGPGNQSKPRKQSSVKPWGLCQREILSEVFKMTGDLDANLRLAKAYKPPTPKPIHFSGVDQRLEPIFKYFGPRQEPSPSK